LILLDNTTIFCQICEDLKDLFAINIQGQLKSHGQVQIFSNDHAKFKFQDGLLHCDGFLYVHDALAQLQVFRARHDILATCHFGFHGVNVARLLVATTMEVCEKVYWILHCLCLSKNSSSSPSWSSSTIVDPYIPVVFNFHGLHHRLSTF
jgi:hypothetical protein